MLRVLNKKDFSGLSPKLSYLTEVKFNPEEYIFPEGLWLEYRDDDNPWLTIKLNIIDKLVTIFYNEFTSDYTDEELSIFLKYNLKFDDLLDWVYSNVEMIETDRKDKKSTDIKNIYLYSFDRYILTYNGGGGDSLNLSDVFSEYVEYVFPQNSVTVRCLPYEWGKVKFFSPDNLDFDDKIYWFNLCILKLYANVTRQHKGSDKKCE